MSEVIELYEFQRTDTGGFFRYTSGADQVAHSGSAYSPQQLMRNSITIEADTSSSLKIDCARNLPVALLFRINPPQQPVKLKITRLQDTTATVVWVGVVNSVSWSSKGASLDCVDMLTYEEKVTFPQNYSKNCRHMLYDNQCGVIPADYRMTIRVSAINVAQRTITYHIITAGFTKIQTLGAIFEEYPVQILEVNGGVGTIADPIVATVSGIPTMSLFNHRLNLGCDRSIYACRTRFNNEANFGGFIALPSKDFAAKIISGE